MSSQKRLLAKRKRREKRKRVGPHRDDRTITVRLNSALVGLEPWHVGRIAMQEVAALVAKETLQGVAAGKITLYPSQRPIDLDLWVVPNPMRSVA